MLRQQMCNYDQLFKPGSKIYNTNDTSNSKKREKKKKKTVKEMCHCVLDNRHDQLA